MAKPEHIPVLVQGGSLPRLKCSKPGCPWEYDDPFSANAQKSFDEHITAKPDKGRDKQAADPEGERRSRTWINAESERS